MLWAMNQDDRLGIDCDTCVAGGTTACNDCVVGHVLANEDGPIPLVVEGRIDPIDRAADQVAERAVELFGRAGLLDDPPVFVPSVEFREGLPAAVHAHPAAGGRPRRRS